MDIKKAQNKKVSKTKKYKHPERWLKDNPPDIDSTIPVIEARKVLAGWDEKGVKEAADSTFQFLNGLFEQSKPTLLDMLVIRDSIDLLSGNIQLLKNSGISIKETVSVLTLREAFNGNSIAALKGAWLLAKVEGAEGKQEILVILERCIPDIEAVQKTAKDLASGRQKGVEANKRLAEARKNLWRLIGIQKLRDKPYWSETRLATYVRNECINSKQTDAIKSVSTIRKALKGIKQEFFKNTSQSK